MVVQRSAIRPLNAVFSAPRDNTDDVVADVAEAYNHLTG